MEPYEDPNHKYNSSKYQSGRKCEVAGCKNPAGIAWSPFWCFKHNAERMRSVDESLNNMLKEFGDLK